MKKEEMMLKRMLIIVVSVTFIVGVSSLADAGWELYDNFDSGAVDPQKWAVDDTCATISIENQQAKFVHAPGYERDSSWLQIIDNPENIIGIRADVRVQSCTGDVRGRLGGWVGQQGENELWSAIEARADEGRITIYVGYDTPTDWLSIFFGGFHYIWENPLDITGKTFTLEWMFSPEQIKGKTDRYGEMTFRYPDPVPPHQSSFKGIGTRSNAGQGPCYVYFDNVYVYRQIPSPATNLLLLDE